MPLFVARLLAWTRRRPMLALLLGGIVGAVVYWQMSPAPPVARLVAAKTPALPGIGAEQTVMQKTLLDVQGQNEQLRLALQETQRTMTQMQQAQIVMQKEHQAAIHVQQQRLEEALRRADQAVHQRSAARPRPQPAPKPPAPPPALPQASGVPATPPASEGRMWIKRIEKPATFTGPPPSPVRNDTAYLPAGSYAEGRLVSGVFATSRSGGALPVLFAVTKPFDGPFQLQGPGRRPLATSLPVDGCLILGKAQGDIASERALMQLDLLSCVMPDGATFERPLKGYATGADGTLGIPGRVETRDGAYLAKTFLTSLMAGAGEAFNLAKRTVVVTPFGGTQSTTTGNVGEAAGYGALASAASQLSQFYLHQAAQLMPVIWVKADTSARLVLQEGLALDGLPTTITIHSGGLQ